MCGIGGFSLAPSDRKTDAVRVARNLLRVLMVRGTDASGAAWAESGGVWWDKAPVNGQEFGRRLSMGPLAKAGIVHTRFATVGDPQENGNNHPFALPGITGIHNGNVKNSRQIFDLLGVERTAPGGTDSEAIFALLAHSGLGPVDCLEMIEGDATCAWLQTERPDVVHVARLDGRPLSVARGTRGSIFFASTRTLLMLALRASEVPVAKAWDVGPGTYLTLVDGKVRTAERFAVARPVFVAPRVSKVSRYDEWDWDDRMLADPYRINPALGLGQ